MSYLRAYQTRSGTVALHTLRRLPQSLMKMTSPALYIIIVQEEETQLASVSTLHQARAGAGLEPLEISPEVQS